MNKLFLMPIIALIAVSMVCFAEAKSCSYSSCLTGGTCVEGSGSTQCPSGCSCGSQSCQPGWTCQYTDICQCDSDSGSWGTCNRNSYCTPEFTSIGAGLAVAGAGIGFMLLRKKRK